jgi:tetratricopeptide (TPR) repeat protein
MNRRRDRRLAAIALTTGLVLLGGMGFGTLAPTHAPESIGGKSASADPHREPGAHAAAARAAEVRKRFDAAALMLHAKQFEPAAAALHRVLELAPQMPEAHVNMGFALLGLQRPKAARDFFESATALRADQANAYYGLALANEAAGDLELALGAMRSYLHLARHEDDAHLRRARAALWEWETKLAARRDVARR